MPFLKKGEKRKDHKYVARIGESPKYRYFYTQAEYNAYLRSENIKNKFQNAKNSFKETLDKTAKTAKDFRSKGETFLNITKQKASSKIEETKNNKAIKAFTNKLNSAAEKTVAELKKASKRTEKFIDKQVANNKVIAKIKSSPQIQAVFNNANKSAANTGNSKKEKKKRDFLGIQAFQKVGEMALKSGTAKARYLDSRGRVSDKERNELVNKARSAENEYSKAMNAFLKTPLGKATTAAKAIGAFATNLADFVKNFGKPKDKDKDKDKDKLKIKDKPKAEPMFTKEDMEKFADSIHKAYKDFVKKNPGFEKVFKPITDMLTPNQNRDAVNPHYEYSPYQMNCYSCSISYDLRKKGFDVTAIPDMYGGMTDKEIASFYKNGKFTSADFSDVYKDDPNGAYEEDERNELSEKLRRSLDKQLLAQAKPGEDSSGFIVIRWQNGGGHIFNYEISNGKVVYIDTQPDSNFSNNDSHSADINMYLSRSKAMDGIYADEDPIRIMRTDNLEINEKNIKYVTTPKNVGNYTDVAKADLEQEAWVYLQMYNDYMADYKKGKITKTEVLLPTTDERNPVTLEQLEALEPKILQLLDEYDIDADWIDNLKYVHK